MAKERLELVTSFEVLRVGMIVVVKPVGCCAASHHRGILVRRVTCEYARRANDMVKGEAFDVLPPRQCYPDLFPVVSESAVTDGRVFRVADGLDPAADDRVAAYEDRLRKRRQRVGP